MHGWLMSRWTTSSHSVVSLRTTKVRTSHESWSTSCTSSTTSTTGRSAASSPSRVNTATRNAVGSAPPGAEPDDDLDDAWDVLAEAVQTVMRAHRVPNSYEKLKELTRGKGGITREDLRAFVATLDIPQADRERLAALTPSTYIGLAARLGREGK